MIISPFYLIAIHAFSVQNMQEQLREKDEVITNLKTEMKNIQEDLSLDAEEQTSEGK